MIIRSEASSIILEDIAPEENEANPTTTIVDTNVEVGYNAQNISQELSAMVGNDYDVYKYPIMTTGDYTLPYNNYVGPGTNVVKNLIEGVVPASHNDLIALEHDVDYLLAENSRDIETADRKFKDRVKGIDGSVYSLMIDLKEKLGLNHRFIGGKKLTSKERYFYMDRLNDIKNIYHNRKGDW